jgi:exosortase
MTYRTKTMILAVLCLGSVLMQVSLFKELWAYSQKHEFASHIFLMPLLSILLVFREKSQFAASAKASYISIIPLAFGLALTFMPALTISLKATGLVLLWIGFFLLLFGVENAGKVKFPLFFLFLMIPIPEDILQLIIVYLQRGSAYFCDVLFKILGMPYYREGVVFALPGINIEIAKECSSIRSSLALLISALLAAHLMLRTSWRKALFILLIVPLSVFKNAIRIVVLSYLAVHYDKAWLTGSELHQRGGIVFFMLALGIMFPILWLLKRSEDKPGISGSHKE